MRFLQFKNQLALTILVVCPLLNAGGQAQAGPITLEQTLRPIEPLNTDFDAAPNPIWIELEPLSGPSMEASSLPAAEEKVIGQSAPSNLLAGLNPLGHGISGAIPFPVSGTVNHHFSQPLCITDRPSHCPPTAASWFIQQSKTNPPDFPFVKFFRPPR
jgi:hypothetical protein